MSVLPYGSLWKHPYSNQHSSFNRAYLYRYLKLNVYIFLLLVNVLSLLKFAKNVRSLSFSHNFLYSYKKHNNSFLHLMQKNIINNKRHPIVLDLGFPICMHAAYFFSSMFPNISCIFRNIPVAVTIIGWPWNVLACSNNANNFQIVFYGKDCRWKCWVIFAAA